MHPPSTNHDISCSRETHLPGPCPQVGVYVGCCGSELHAGWLMDVKGITGYEQTGCTLSMFANRLSFSFDFRGPSMSIDTGAQQGFPL